MTQEMSHRDAKAEKLVEEIAEIWGPWGEPGGYYPAWVKRQRAKRTISRISQAIEKGEIKLPNEVGRWIPKSAGGDESGGGFSWRILKEIGRAPILIALSPTAQDKEGGGDVE